MIRSSQVIAIPDLERSARCYRQALAFEVREIGDPGWHLFVRDECRIMAGACAEVLPADETGDHACIAYPNVDDVDDVDAEFRRTNAAGAEILEAPASKAWGMRECALRTADGHRVLRGQVIERT